MEVLADSRRIDFHLQPEREKPFRLFHFVKMISKSALKNGTPLDRCWLTCQEIMAGGTPDLVLGPDPNKQWGLATQ